MHAGRHGEHWQRKQIQAVGSLRVKLHGNTISSALMLPLSFCLFGLPTLISLSLSPSIPVFLLATACWLEKWAWPQVNPSAYLSDPSRGTSPPAATNTHIGILLTAAHKPTCNIKASWCNLRSYCMSEGMLNGNSNLIGKESWCWKFLKESSHLEFAKWTTVLQHLIFLTCCLTLLRSAVINPADGTQFHFHFILCDISRFGSKSNSQLDGSVA